MQITKVASLTSPLCYLPNGKLVCYHRGSISVLNDGNVEKKFSIHVSVKERLLGWSRYATRLLRFGIRSAIAFDNDHIVISIGNMLHEIDLSKETVSKGWFCGEGIRPLMFTDVKGIEGFDDGLYFGGYLMNMDKKPVNVYHRTGVDKWDVVYTFPQGVINHIHTMLSDPYRNCLWAFTGDFDEASAIWKITDNFEKVDRVLYNNQKYRGCVAFVTQERLLYATDAPFTDNYIYQMNPDTYGLEEVCPIDGSCIYGCQWNDQLVFSSTVEGDGRNQSLLTILFGRKRGCGIKDENVHLYCGNLTNGFSEIYKEEKDLLPFFLFQLGAFKFPYGDNNTNTLYFQPFATRKNDLSLMNYSLQL